MSLYLEREERFGELKYQCFEGVLESISYFVFWKHKKSQNRQLAFHNYRKQYRRKKNIFKDDKLTQKRLLLINSATRHK